ncbi:MAG TPA: HEAT repeat domain-containing protein [Vicinamibacterales bacterium]|nr:HEAT repeat domain-containing protein [Vicinamibacterales bacterium]
MRLVTTTIGAGLAVLSISAALGARGGQTQPARPGAPAEENILIAQGWSSLVAGQLTDARAKAEQVVQRYPRNVAGAVLLVEVEIARGGGLAGLSAYDAWMGDRKVEDGNLLRRVSRAMLWDAARVPEASVDALQYLAADGDAEARGQLARRMLENSLGETRALARIGDEAAARKLIDTMDRTQGSKTLLIAAVVETRSPLAIPSLIRILDDTNHPENVAAAANGLGQLNARNALPQLQRLFTDQAQISPVRFSAAGALIKLGDTSGLAFLQARLMQEAFPNGGSPTAVRLAAARELAGQPDRSWITVLEEALNDPAPDMRVQAAELLAPYEVDLVRGAVERLLRDDNPAVRERAGKLLVQRLAGDFGTLRRMLRSPDAPVQVAAAGRILELSR